MAKDQGEHVARAVVRIDAFQIPRVDWLYQGFSDTIDNFIKGINR